MTVVVELYPFFSFRGGWGANPAAGRGPGIGGPVMYTLMQKNIAQKQSFTHRYCWFSNKSAPFTY